MREADSIVASAFGFPIKCSPIGSLFLVKPHGILAAGYPIMFIGNVFGKAPQNSSTGRPFILVGGFPTGNAGTEVVGVKIKSKLSKIEEKFDLITSISPTA